MWSNTLSLLWKSQQHLNCYKWSACVYVSVHVWILITGETGSWPEPYFNLCGSTTGDDKGFTLQRSWRKPPSPCQTWSTAGHYSIRRELQSRTWAFPLPQLDTLLCVSTFSGRVFPFGGLSLRPISLPHFMGDGWILKTFFCILTQYSVLFHS